MSWIDTVMYVGIGAIVCGVIGFFVWWQYYFKSFNKVVDILDATVTGYRVFTDKARIRVGKDKVSYWEFYKVKTGKRKLTLPPPPKDSIMLMFNGNQKAAVLRHGTDDFRWIDYAKMQNPENVTSPDVLTTEQKQAMTNQYAIAVEEASTEGSNLIQKFLPIVVIAVLLIFSFIIIKLDFEKVQEMSNANVALAGQMTAASNTLAQAMTEYKDLVVNRQTATTDNGGTNKPAPN